MYLVHAALGGIIYNLNESIVTKFINFVRGTQVRFNRMRDLLSESYEFSASLLVGRNY